MTTLQDPRRYFESVAVARNDVAERPPVCLYLEVTNRCNLLCETCPRTFEDLEPPADMSWELFTRIVDQAAEVDFDLWRSGDDEIERMKNRIRNRQADEFDTPWPVSLTKKSLVALSYWKRARLLPAIEPVKVAASLAALKRSSSA